MFCSLLFVVFGNHYSYLPFLSLHVILQETTNFFIFLFFLSFRYTALAVANPGIYTYLILRCSFFCCLFWLSFFSFVSLSFLVCARYPLYIPPLFAALSPFSMEFIYALHYFQSILHPKVLIMPHSFAKTPLKISLTSGRGCPAEVKTTTRSIQELSAISAFIQTRARSPLTKCKNSGCARRSHPCTYFCYDSKNVHSPEC